MPNFYGASRADIAEWKRMRNGFCLLTLKLLHSHMVNEKQTCSPLSTLGTMEIVPRNGIFRKVTHVGRYSIDALP